MRREAARRRAGGDRRAIATLAVASLALALAAGFALKDQCTRHAWDGYQYRRSCYSDVYALYFGRGFQERAFPYTGFDLEYPVGTGLVAGGVAAVVRGGTAFFRANAAALALAGFAAALALATMVRDRRRILFFTLAPAIVLYAFHNWDLLAVAFAAAALAAFARRRDGAAGALLGLGAATKVFPGVMLPALVAARWRESGRPPVRLVAWAIGGFAALNLPILLLNPSGWLYPWRFQTTRFPNFETHWYFVFHHLGRDSPGGSFWWTTYPALTGWLAAIAFLAGGAVLVRAEWRRERVRPYALAYGLLLVFMLTGKVFSPQFALWLLPFFAILAVPWRDFAVFAVAEASVWFAISGYLLVAQNLSEGDAAFRLALVEVTTLVRYLVLGRLLWRSRGIEERVDEAAPAAPSAPVAAS